MKFSRVLAVASVVSCSTEVVAPDSTLIGSVDGSTRLGEALRDDNAIPVLALNQPVQINDVNYYPDEVVVDKRDGKKYYTKKYFGKSWFTHNLAYEGCGGDSYGSPTYGNLYAIENQESFDCCPTNWRLPTKADYEELFGSLHDVWDNHTDSINHLLVANTSKWYDGHGMIFADMFGFNVLPSGYKSSAESTISARGYTARLVHADNGYIDLSPTDQTPKFVDEERLWGSVRCVQDSNSDIYMELKTTQDPEAVRRRIGSRLALSSDQPLGVKAVAGQPLSIITFGGSNNTRYTAKVQVVIGTAGLTTGNGDVEEQQVFNLQSAVLTHIPGEDVLHGGAVYWRAVMPLDYQGVTDGLGICGIASDSQELEKIPTLFLNRTLLSDFKAQLAAVDDLETVHLVGDYFIATALAGEFKRVYSDERLNPYVALLQKDYLMKVQSGIAGLTNASDHAPGHRGPSKGLRINAVLTNENDFVSEGITGFSKFEDFGTPIDMDGFEPKLIDGSYFIERAMEYLKPEDNMDVVDGDSSDKLFRLITNNEIQTTAERYLISSAEFQMIKDKYLSLPVAERDYDLIPVVGISYDRVRFAMWQQLYALFGVEIFSRIHRLYRDQVGDVDSSRASFMLAASRVARQNLVPFFEHWGFKLSTNAEMLALKGEVSQLWTPYHDTSVWAYLDSAEILSGGDVNCAAGGQQGHADCPILVDGSTGGDVNTIKSDLNVMVGENVWVDSRDGQEYPFIQLGKTKWFQRNLTYESPEAIPHPETTFNELAHQYGYMYPVQISSNELCPEGFYVAGKSDFYQAMEDIRTKLEENVKHVDFTDRMVRNAMKLGGDANETVGALWSADYYNSQDNHSIYSEMAALNILPAGLWDSQTGQYVPGLEAGKAGVFIGASSWYVTGVLGNSEDEFLYANWHSHQYGSIRCVSKI